MNNARFIELVASSDVAVQRLKANAHAVFEGVARDEEIPVDELSDEELEAIADGFVERGLNE
jgi:hypothetical protein